MVMNEFLKLFGQRLAAVRKERGWSQEQLALESGVARSYLSGVERGQRNISGLQFNECFVVKSNAEI